MLKEMALTGTYEVKVERRDIKDKRGKAPLLIPIPQR